MPAIENPVGAAVNVSPATLKMDCGADGKGGRGKVLTPLTKMPWLDGNTEYVVPETTAVGPPALMTAPLGRFKAGYAPGVAADAAGVTTRPLESVIGPVGVGCTA